MRLICQELARVAKFGLFRRIVNLAFDFKFFDNLTRLSRTLRLEYNESKSHDSYVSENTASPREGRSQKIVI